MSVSNLQPVYRVLTPKHLTPDLTKSTKISERRNRLSFQRNVAGTVMLTVLLYPVIGDNSDRKANRAIPRYNNGQLHEAIVLLNQLSRPIHGRGFPNGDIELIFGHMEW